MNLGRIFATALARRVAFVLVALVLGAFGIGTARAVEYPTQGEAFLACKAAIADAMSSFPPSSNGQYPQVFRDCTPSGSTGYTCVVYANNNSTPRCRAKPGDPWSTSISFTWKAANSCANQPVMQNARLTGSAGGCTAGCEYAPTIGGGKSATSVEVGGQTIFKFDEMAPTGEVCLLGEGLGVPNTSQTDECVQDGTLTQCVKANGDLCSQASNGKRFCWSPTESGVKTSGNEAASKVPAGESANIPPVAPTNGGDWKQKSSTPVTQTVTDNSTTNVQNSTINHYESSYGKEGGGAKGGGAEGEKGGGGGSGSGDGDGDGDGHGEVSGGGSCEEPIACSGGDPVLCAIARQQYLARCEADARFKEGHGDIPVEDVGDDPDPADGHRRVTLGLGRIDQSGFLGGGSCPQFEVADTSFGPFQVDGDQWCQLIGVARVCLLLLGAFIALGILMGRGSD